MQIDHRVALGDEVALQPVGNHSRGGATGIAREGAVEVAAIKRRAAQTGAKGRGIGSRHQDQPAGHIFGPQIAREAHDGRRPLIFVAMHAAQHQNGGPGPTRNGDDRHGIAA